jgi:hypothetical protein
MLNIIIGVLMIISGLGGAAVLRGTNSSGALVLLGVSLVAFGLFRVSRHS